MCTVIWVLAFSSVIEMVYSRYKRQSILHHCFQVHNAPTIAKLLLEEGLKASHIGIVKFLVKYRETGSVERRTGSGRSSKITTEIKKVVQDQMRLDDETTAYQLHQLLARRGYNISVHTILQCRTAMGWSSEGVPIAS